MLNVESVPYTEHDRFLVEGDTLCEGPVLERTIEERAVEVDFTDPYTRLPWAGGDVATSFRRGTSTR